MNFTTHEQHAAGYAEGHQARSGAIGRAFGYLLSIASAALGMGIAAIAWIVAAISYDGTTLFGCSDGNKYPNVGAGNVGVVVGFVALIAGFVSATAVWRGVSKFGHGR